MWPHLSAALIQFCPCMLPPSVVTVPRKPERPTWRIGACSAACRVCNCAPVQTLHTAHLAICAGMARQALFNSGLVRGWVVTVGVSTGRGVCCAAAVLPPLMHGPDLARPRHCLLFVLTCSSYGAVWQACRGP